MTATEIESDRPKGKIEEVQEDCPVGLLPWNEEPYPPRREKKEQNMQNRQIITSVGQNPVQLSATYLYLLN